MSLKTSLIALFALGGVAAFAAPSSAAPLAPVQLSHDGGSAVQQVGWRCGPGGHVNRWGRCVPNRRGPVVRRACPRGTHLTRRGYCVRNW